MIRSFHIILIGYIFLSSLNVIGELLPFKKKIRYVTTPMAMPLLMVYVLVQGFTPWLLMAGLFFSMVGDVVLMFPEKRDRRFFFAGTLSFMLAHGIYFLYFIWNIQWIKIPILIWVIIAVVSAGGISLYLRMWKNLSGLRLIIGIYTLALTAVAAIILLNYSSMDFRLFLGAASGILLFLLSDALLSQDWFIQEFSLARPAAMITYLAAQLLLVTAVLEII